MASSEEIILYYESGSTPCMAIMLALEEKGASYTKKEVDTEKDEDIAMLEEVADRDEPPALLHGDQVLFDEVVPACLYLEKIFDNNRMIPEGAVQRAHVIKRMIQAQKIGVGDTSIDAYWEDDEEDDEEDDNMDEEKAEALEEKEDKQDLAEELEEWEFYLTKGSFIAGSEFTMADCVFIPVLIYLVTNGLDLTKKYPLLHKYYTTVMERPSVVEVGKHHQIDAEDIFKDMPTGVLAAVGDIVKGFFGKLVNK
ncbi:Hypp4238 [Branchiostoma lanceolatum]|uniref:Hypp4238 protein n=1 Tax=Branchiostoma lanceolatum TaxID=7740 RepID=A0A8K0F068_BRALA|nr:Hypp4238 [Branchiostoma lanceolatum]